MHPSAHAASSAAEAGSRQPEAHGHAAWLRRRLRPPVEGQRGALLVEVLVALAVLGVLGTTVLGAVQTSNVSKRQFEIQSTAENLVRNQIESVFEQSYTAPDAPDPTYPSVIAPAGYAVTADAIAYDSVSTDIETVRITVYHGGGAVRVFETLRANR